MTQPVPYWGLHSDGGDLFFLHEQKRSRCLTPGLEGLESPLEVVRGDRMTCPHSLLPFGELIDTGPLKSELAQKLAPVPDGGAYWVPTAAKPLIQEAHIMCRPMRPIAFVPWAHAIKRLVGELLATNVAPLIITDYEAKDLPDLARLVELPRVRTIILCGDLRIGTARRCDWAPENRDWIHAGAAALQGWIAERVKEARQ